MKELIDVDKTFLIGLPNGSLIRMRAGMITGSTSRTTRGDQHR
jgi:hypothetical protein